MQVRQVHPVFAAEISGVDISRPLDAGAIDAIQAAIDDHAVVYFRNQTLTDAQQIDFASQFGTPERYALSYRHNHKLRLERPEMVDISNLDASTGMVQDRAARHRLLLLSSRLWHIDSSYRNPVGALSMLFAHQIPPEGGETEFADMRAAYDALPERLQQRIADMQAEHCFVKSSRKLGFAEFASEEEQVLAPVYQPVVRPHTRTGRKAIYLGWHAIDILGIPAPESRVLMADLLELSTQREFVYRHTWQVGDLVIWDNRSVMHRGRDYDESYVRDMRRVTTVDAAVGSFNPASVQA